jgi:hypothetical protein
MRRDSVRAVLDTNVLVSALLYQGGRLSWSCCVCWPIRSSVYSLPPDELIRQDRSKRKRAAI